MIQRRYKFQTWIKNPLYLHQTTHCHQYDQTLSANLNMHGNFNHLFFSTAKRGRARWCHQPNFSLTLILYAERRPIYGKRSETQKHCVYKLTWKSEKQLIAGQTKWRRCSIGTGHRPFRQCQASCPSDAAGKNFVLECSIGKMSVQAFHFLSSNARCVYPSDFYQVRQRNLQISNNHILKPWYSNWSIRLCHAWGIVCHGWFQSMSAGGPTRTYNTSKHFRQCNAQLQTDCRRNHSTKRIQARCH